MILVSIGFQRYFSQKIWKIYRGNLVMSQYEVKTINHPLDCTVEVPGSKSITNRALLMAALADGKSV